MNLNHNAAAWLLHLQVRVLPVLKLHRVVNGERFEGCT